MAGRFINTDNKTVEITDNLISSMRDILKNPYYLFNDKRASICTYYNLNTTMTTLDAGDRGNYNEIGTDSPLRFNKVNKFYLYGISRIEPTVDVDEFGLEGSDIQGEAIVLPNTVIPYPNDFFTLDQLGDSYLFKVTAVQPSTLETGSILYKINYTLGYSDGVMGDINEQVVKIYNFVPTNLGTNFASLMEEDVYNFVTELEKYTIMLKDYYMSLFYDEKVQNFTYTRDPAYPSQYSSVADIWGLKVYDPYLIEFLIRNNTLKGASQYLVLQQSMYLPSTFAIDYSKTIFASIEDKDIQDHQGRFVCNLWLCTQKLSLLYAYPQDYYYCDYIHTDAKLHLVDIFNDPSFANRIKNNEKTENDVLKDILIMYFNDEDITMDIIKKIKHIDYMPSPELYYMIPFTIHSLEHYIQKLLATTSI